MMSEAPRAVKRRRKVVKSCTFCRKRKLKCDHGKPMCNQCLERKLPNCLYTDHFNFQLTTDELFSDSPNVELIRRIKELEEKLERNSAGRSVECDRSVSPSSSSSQFSSTGSSSSKNNPLWGYRTFIQMDGQSLVFGPTSWRTTVVAQGSRFVEAYKKLWDMIIPERCKWMNLSLNSQKLPLTPQEDSVTSALCDELPGFKEIKRTVNDYFDDDYHAMFEILDRDKTLKDLEQCFVRSSEDEDRVVDIIAPDRDGNFCKAANILMILCIMNTAAPPSIMFDNFFISLSAFNLSSKLSFVERAQFLLLRFFNKVYYSYVCSEAPQMSGMIAELCECSLNLGLAEADTYYKDKESEVGPVYTLNNAWLWTLYADILVAFEFGTPLLISDDHFDPEILKHEQPMQESGNFVRRRRLMLMKFIEVSRHCITEVNSRSSSGNLEVTIEQLIAYISENLLPMRFYTSQERFSSVDFFDVIVLAPSLGMLLNFHNIQRMWVKSTTASTKNGLIKFGFLSLSLSVNTIIGVLERDKHLKGGHRALHFALMLVNPLLMRVLSEMYAAFFHKLSLFEDGLIKSIDWGTRAIDLSNLDVPLSEYYSFVGAIKMFRQIIDELFDPAKADLQVFFSQSFAIETTLALERVSRTLFDKARESRTKAENYCTFTEEGTISQETLNEMTDIFWSTYDQQSQDLWSMKPQDFEEKRLTE